MNPKNWFTRIKRSLKNKLRVFKGEPRFESFSRHNQLNGIKNKCFYTKCSKENIKMKKEYLKIINLGEKKCPNQERGWSETMDPCMAKLFKKSKYWKLGKNYKVCTQKKCSKEINDLDRYHEKQEIKNNTRKNK